MSSWGDPLRAVQEAALLQCKVDQALNVAGEARRLSIETRERVILVEAFSDRLKQQAMARRLPPE